MSKKVKVQVLGEVVVVTKRNGHAFIASSAQHLVQYGVNVIGDIINNLSENKGDLMFSQSRGYHSLLSVIGNGRWRDRGVSTDLLITLLSNPSITKNLDVRYKMTEDGVEPVIETQSLQKMLTEIKDHIVADSNGLTASLNYKGTSVKLNMTNYARIKNYL